MDVVPFFKKLIRHLSASAFLCSATDWHDKAGHDRYVQRAREEIGTGHVEKAATLLKIARAFAPYDGFGWSLLGEVHQRQGKSRLSRRCFKTAAVEHRRVAQAADALHRRRIEPSAIGAGAGAITFDIACERFQAGPRLPIRQDDLASPLYN